MARSINVDDTIYTYLKKNIDKNNDDYLDSKEVGNFFGKDRKKAKETLIKLKLSERQIKSLLFLYDYNTQYAKYEKTNNISPWKIKLSKTSTIKGLQNKICDTDVSVRQSAINYISSRWYNFNGEDFVPALIENLKTETDRDNISKTIDALSCFQDYINDEEMLTLSKLLGSSDFWLTGKIAATLQELLRDYKIDKKPGIYKTLLGSVEKIITRELSLIENYSPLEGTMLPQIDSIIPQSINLLYQTVKKEDLKSLANIISRILSSEHGNIYAPRLFELIATNECAGKSIANEQNTKDIIIPRILHGFSKNSIPNDHLLPALRLLCAFNLHNRTILNNELKMNLQKLITQNDDNEIVFALAYTLWALSMNTEYEKTVEQFFNTNKEKLEDFLQYKKSYMKYYKDYTEYYKKHKKLPEIKK